MLKISINLKQRDLIAVMCALATQREPLAQQVVDLVTTTAPDHITRDDKNQEIDALYVIPVTQDQLDCIDRVANYYDGTLHALAADIKDIPDWSTERSDHDHVPLCMYPARKR